MKFLKKISFIKNLTEDLPNEAAFYPGRLKKAFAG